jgi:type VI protein secretion system component VasF
MNRMRQIKSERKGENRRARSRTRWLYALGCIAVLAVAASAGLVRTDAQEAFPLPAIDPPGAKTVPTAAKAGPPGAQAAPTPASAQPVETTAGNADATDVAKQCADLLKMATELKSAVDKTSSSTLSVTVVRKAGEIEQLAHKVRIGSGRN